MLVALAAFAAVLHTVSAGIHLFGVAALNPTWRELDGPAYLLVKQAADRRFPTLMRPITLLGLAAVVALAVVATVVDAQPAGSLATGGVRSRRSSGWSPSSAGTCRSTGGWPPGRRPTCRPPGGRTAGGGSGGSPSARVPPASPRSPAWRPWAPWAVRADCRNVAAHDAPRRAARPADPAGHRLADVHRVRPRPGRRPVRGRGRRFVPGAERPPGGPAGRLADRDRRAAGRRRPPPAPPWPPTR